MKLKAVRGEIVPAAFAEYKISQGSRRHLGRIMMMMIILKMITTITTLLWWCWWWWWQQMTVEICRWHQVWQMEIQRDVDKLRRIFVATSWNAHKDCGHGNGDDNIVHDNYHWQAPEAGGCSTGDGGDRETGDRGDTGEKGDTGLTWSTV